MTDNKHSRRAFLAGVGGMSAVGLTSLGRVTGQRSADQTASKTASTANRGFNKPSGPEQTDGSLTKIYAEDPLGNPVSGANVSVYDNSTYELIASRGTGEEGEFYLEDSSDITISVTDSSGLFEIISAGEFNEGSTITLNQKFIQKPTPAVATDGTESTLISVWRTANSFSDTQALFIELTGLNRQPTQSQWEVNSDSYFDISKGSFSVTYPENDISIDYGFKDDVGDSYGHSVYTAANQGPDSGNQILEKLHPKRKNRPQIPLYESVPEVSGSVLYGRVDNKNTISEGFGRALNSVGPVGSALSVASQIKFVFGLSSYLESNLGEELEPLDQNLRGRVSHPWKADAPGQRDAASVVFVLPFRFDTSTGARFQIAAEWQQPGLVKEAAGITGAFTLDTKLAPLSPDVANGGAESKDPDNDGLYEDLNGDGTVNDADVKLLSNNIDALDTSSQSRYFDFNNNGEVDYADVVALSEESE